MIVSPVATTFDLIVRTRAGVVQALALNAQDAAAARAQAVGDGFEVLACAAQMRRLRWRLRPRAGARARRLDVANLSYELSALMAAGLSMTEALRTLAQKERSAARRAVVLGVVASVNEGLSLSAALRRHPMHFPPLLVATVSASEQTGDLSTALRRYAEHQQGVKALRDKVVGAAVYPILLLAVGCVVVLFLLGVVVPKFAVLIESTRRELPWSSQLMLSWGRLVADNAATMGLAAAAAAVALVVAVRRLVQTGARSRWVESVPFVGPAMRQFRHSQLYRTTGMLVRGGIAAPRALELSASLLGDADQARLRRAVSWVHEGRSLSAALSESMLADPVATSMLAVAERTGTLAEILERIAQFHESSLQRSVDMTGRLFEPILMIGIGLVIGAIVVLMYLPIFDLASSLQ